MKMITQRNDRLQRHIDTLQSQLEKLKSENEDLRRQNASLIKKASIADEAISEYKKLSEELSVLKFKYYNAFRDTVAMKHEFSSKFADHINRIKRQK